MELKNNMTPSIFTIEKRKDFVKEFNKVDMDISNTIIKPSSGPKMSLYDYLNYCIRYWPYRCGALDISSYINSMNLTDVSEKSERFLLHLCELFINLLHYAIEQERYDFRFTNVLDAFGPTTIVSESERILQNIDYMLEQCCNMYVRVDKSEKFPKYIISKRDADVDSALESATDLSEYLLGYLDIRNENDLEYKKKTLIEIYNFLEPERSTYKNSFAGKMSETFFSSMNKLNIRHNDEKQIVLPNHERRNVYDELFKIGLFVIRSQELLDYQKDLEAIYKE